MTAVPTHLYCRRYVKWPQESVTEGEGCSSAAVHGSCHDVEDHMLNDSNTDGQCVDPLAEVIPCGSESNSKQQSDICSGSSKVCEGMNKVQNQLFSFVDALGLNC